MLAGCGGTPAEESSHATGLSTDPTSGEVAKEWKVVETAPAAGANYRLAMVHTNIEGSPTLWLKDQNQKEAEPDYDKAKDFYIATAQDVADAAVVEVSTVEGGYKVKIGARYLQIILDGTYIDSFLVAEADASTMIWSETHKTVGVTLNVNGGDHFCGLGTRNDKTFDTAGGTDFDKYPENIKVQLYEYK